VTEDAALFRALTADHGPLRSRTVGLITAIDRHCRAGLGSAHMLTSGKPAGHACPLLPGKIWRNSTSINGKFINVTVLLRAYAYNDSIENCQQFLNISFILQHLQKWGHY